MHKYNELIDIDISQKNILIREDLNVPIKDNKIANDARIKAAAPTINYALSKGAKVAIISHLGRPTEGVFEKKYSLKIVAERLSEILNKKVYFESQPLDAKSPEYKNDLTLYENTRFLIGEKSGDENLAKKYQKIAMFLLWMLLGLRTENILLHILFQNMSLYAAEAFF